jgi:hypothetical protein
MGDVLKRWRFWIEDFDGNVEFIDQSGGPDGDDPSAEFVGSGHDAIAEGDRRANLWECRTRQVAAKLVRESRGVVAQ